MNVFEIITEIESIEQEIIEAGGELTPDIEQRLDDMTRTFFQKAEGYYQAITEMQSEAKSCKELSKKYATKAKSKENAVERVENMFKDAMLKQGKRKVTTPLGNFVVTPSEKLVVTNVEGVPEKWRVPVHEPDKVLAKEVKADWSNFYKLKRAEYKVKSVDVTQEQFDAWLGEWMQDRNLLGAASISRNQNIKLT